MEGGEENGGDEKEREGNNVLPHLKRAVAAYVM